MRGIFRRPKAMPAPPPAPEALLLAAACQDCGACCAEGFHCVEVEEDEPFALLHRALLRRDFGVLQLPRPTGRCPCLVGERPALRCAAYPLRPRSCRELPVGGEACALARTRVGLPPLAP